MRFNVRYIPRGDKQHVETIVTGPDERAVGWAFVQRGDQLISIERADRPRPAANVATPATPPARPPSAVVVYGVVALLMLIGIAMPAYNLDWLYQSDAAVDASADDLTRMQDKVALSKQTGFYRESYEDSYIKPRQEKLSEARLEMARPMVWCLFGVLFLGGALLLAHRHRTAERRWVAWQAMYQRTSVARG